jgi:hypothetical protein
LSPAAKHPVCALLLLGCSIQVVEEKKEENNVTFGHTKKVNVIRFRKTNNKGPTAKLRIINCFVISSQKKYFQNSMLFSRKTEPQKKRGLPTANRASF